MSDVYDEISAGEIPRDRLGRPMVTPPTGGKPVAYTRVTTFAGALEDGYALGGWQQRMVALGLAARKDLLLAVSAHANDKTELNKIVDQAREAAAASAAATTGTALHKLAERYDRGELGLSDVPESHRGDLEAYARALKPFTIHGVEQFLVIDPLQIGGTADRILEYDGQRYIADIKTGSIEYGAGKMATQLALYSRGQTYRHGETERGETGVSTTAGIIIHLPAGEARCDLYWINLAAGWEAVDLCDRVRQWRKRKGFLAPAAFAAPVVEPNEWTEAARVVDKLAVVAQAFPDAEDITADLAARITACADGAELEALWLEHRDEWTAEHTRLAKSHKTHLHQQALRGAVAMVTRDVCTIPDCGCDGTPHP